MLLHTLAFLRCFRHWFPTPFQVPKIGLEGKPNVYLMRVLPSEGQIKIFNVSGFEYSDKSKVGMEAKPSINEKEFALRCHHCRTGSPGKFWLRSYVVEKGKACPFTYLAHDVDLLLRLLIRLLIVRVIRIWKNPGKTKNQRIDDSIENPEKCKMSMGIFKGQNRIP